jgi:large subunit ribosomal protein L32
MAVPKKKVSRSRRNMRRFSSAYKMVITEGSNCSSCGEIRRPHTVCRCGVYDGKAVLPAPKAREATTPTQA